MSRMFGDKNKICVNQRNLRETKNYTATLE